MWSPRRAMLLHLQFPFSDLRNFLPDSPALRLPSWPAPIPDEEFVRCFGPVRKRGQGGLSGWIAEAECCDARRAVLFAADTLSGKPAGGPRLQIAFRRLFFDGYAVGKTEIGLTTQRASAEAVRLDEAVRHVLDLPVRVPHRVEPVALGMAGKPVSELYAYASCKLREGRQPERGELKAEMPMVFIEAAAADGAPPREARQVALAAEVGFDLFFWHQPRQGGSVAVWCLLYRPGARADVRARHLRIYLLRLNAEHQALKRVLRAVDSGKIAPEPRGPASQILQGYVFQATRHIGRCEEKTQNFSGELDVLAYSLFDTLAPGERDSIAEKLRLVEVRSDILRRVEAYAAKATINIGQYIASAESVMSTTTSVTNSQNVNIGSTLTNVQQTVQAMPVGNDADRKELQDLLAKLHDALKAAPAEKAAAAGLVASRTDELVKAGADKNPDKSMLRMIGDGLKQAAEFLKDAVPSALTIAGQIVAVVGRIHGIPL